MAVVTALLLARLSVWATTFAGGQPPASTGAIEGVVSAQQGGRPLERAEIVVLNDDTARVEARRTSDIDGRFVVVGLAAGTYRISASRHGFATADATVVVTGGRTTRTAVAL